MDKNYILAEIKRKAAEKGGLPFSWNKFHDETGIKETDWLGKHWARHNDALKEAGVPLNQMQAA